MRRNLPGPFTFVLRGKNKLPKIFRQRKSGEIGIRMPDSEIVRDLLEALGAPLMTASLPANHPDEPEYLLDPELIEEEYASAVDLIVDGGMGKLGQSTVVDCSDEDNIEIVRQGDGELL